MKRRFKERILSHVDTLETLEETIRNELHKIRLMLDELYEIMEEEEQKKKKG